MLDFLFPPPKKPALVPYLSGSQKSPIYWTLHKKFFSSALISSCPVTCPRASLVQVSCKPITCAMLGGLRVRVGTNYMRAMPPRHKVPYARAASSSIFGTIQHLLSSEGALAFKDLHVKKVLHTPTLSSLPRSVAVFHELRTNRDLESFDAADFMDGARASVPLVHSLMHEVRQVLRGDSVGASPLFLPCLEMGCSTVLAAVRMIPTCSALLPDGPRGHVRLEQGGGCRRRVAARWLPGRQLATPAGLHPHPISAA